MEEMRRRRDAVGIVVGTVQQLLLVYKGLKLALKGGRTNHC